MNISNLFNLNASDFVKGIAVAILSGLVAAASPVVLSGNFDAWSVNWTLTLHMAVNVAIIAGFSYLVKNFFSDNQGKIFGRIG